MPIPDAYKKVPMMFRAQVGDRCQLQFIKKEEKRRDNAENNHNAKPDIQRWAEEWIERASDPIGFGEEVQSRAYAFGWRLVTNGGQDDGIVRPVIGARGLPFFPGSSMKGAFARACSVAQRDRYCGVEITKADWAPGLLRFHGGYPTSDRWQSRLVDIVHPQQRWQVKSHQKEGGAFAQISLYQPEFSFGISSQEPIAEAEWTLVWEIWERAIAQGLGCRVSAGYGQPRIAQGKSLYSTRLKGQGMAPKLLDGTYEFRPNIFKAAIRGHALRIFGGLTDEQSAERAVAQLFGGTEEQGGTVGLLSLAFREEKLKLDSFGRDARQVGTYEVEGSLSWRLTRALPPEQQSSLKLLIQALTCFGMVLGGFGKSWRRADHRLFYRDYYEGGASKSLIGCHWQWNGKSALLRDVRVRKLGQVGAFIDNVRKLATDWLISQEYSCVSGNYAKGWQEAWHPDRVQVWGRDADDADDSVAIAWFHQPYIQGNRRDGIPTGSIYKTEIAGWSAKKGQDSKVGRIWHRMYPVVRLDPDPQNPDRKLASPTPRFLELLVFFPDGSEVSEQFLDFLASDRTDFRCLWPRS